MLCVIKEMQSKSTMRYVTPYQDGTCTLCLIDVYIYIYISHIYLMENKRLQGCEETGTHCGRNIKWFSCCEKIVWWAPG